MTVAQFIGAWLLLGVVVCSIWALAKTDVMWSFRWYRRREMRKRLMVVVRATPPCEECGLCGSGNNLKRLNNGGIVCDLCQRALAAYRMEGI